MKRLFGDTYPHRHLLRCLGAQYDPKRKCWEVPDDKYAEAKALVGKKLDTGRMPTNPAVQDLPRKRKPLFTGTMAHPQFVEGCITCAEIRDKYDGFGPSHNGSAMCGSGSIASGGTVAHCTCDRCF